MRRVCVMEVFIKLRRSNNANWASERILRQVDLEWSSRLQQVSNPDFELWTRIN